MTGVCALPRSPLLLIRIQYVWMHARFLCSVRRVQTVLGAHFEITEKTGDVDVSSVRGFTQLDRFVATSLPPPVPSRSPVPFGNSPSNKSKQWILCVFVTRRGNSASRGKMGKVKVLD